MTLASNATGTAASMMFENTKPVRKSTLSSRTYFSAIWRPTSGLNWSSPTSTSAGRPPSLPPFIFTASWKPSRMSTPSAALGPESVLMKPTLTLSAACALEARASGGVNAPIHDHRHAEIARQREDVLFGIALAERVVDLQEIVLLRLQPALDLGISRRRVVGDADVTHALPVFPLEEGFRVGRDIHQVVYLHEVHLLHFQAAERLLHLPHAFVSSAGPDLGCDEQPLAQAELGDQVPGHGLGRAVHRRGVQDPAAAGGEGLQHFAQRRALGGSGADVERLPGADTDHREWLERRGNGPRDQLLRVVWHHAARRERGKHA